MGLNGLGRFCETTASIAGVIPRISLLLGPCTGVMSALPVLSDFLIVNEDSGFLWLGGEAVSDEAGSAEFHMEKSGQCDMVAQDDEDAIARAKELIAFLPGQLLGECRPLWIPEMTRKEGKRNCWISCRTTPSSPTIFMTSSKRSWINGDFFELKEDFASHLVIGFCRFGGRVAGVVANNPDELSGILEPDASDKYDRFMSFLDAFNIPLVTLVDTTAFPPGDRWERMGIIRHGAKLLHSYAHLTCPKITMVLRRSYGGANIVLGCSKMFPDFVYTWPTAEFAPTGPETVVHAIFHKELAKAKEQGNYDEVYRFLWDPERTVFGDESGQDMDHLLYGPRSDRSQGHPAQDHQGPGP